MVAIFPALSLSTKESRDEKDRNGGPFPFPPLHAETASLPFSLGGNGYFLSFLAPCRGCTVISFYLFLYGPVSSAGYIERPFLDV